MTTAALAVDPADFLAITTVKARYFRYIDTKQWGPLRALFTNDAQFLLPSLGQFENIDAAIAALSGRLVTAVTIHHGHMPEIEMVGDDTATGIFAMYDRVMPAPGETLSGPAGMSAGRQGYGHYTDTFRREADGWRICALRLDRLYHAAL